MDREIYDDDFDESENNSNNEDQNSENTEEESSESQDNEDEKGESKEEEQSSESEEQDPYEAKLKELEKENEELKRNKTEAIRQERQKRKIAEARLAEKGTDTEDNDDKPMTRKEFEDLMLKRENEQKIKQVSSTESEEKLIRKYVTLGYSVDDAFLKANSHIIQEAKEAERERLEQENLVAGYSRAVPRGKAGSPAYATDPILKKAADGLTPEERKYL